MKQEGRSQRATLQHAQRRLVRCSEWIEREDGTVAIPLGNGKTAIIDHAFREAASQYYWRPCKSSSNFYAQAFVPGSDPRKVIFLHHLVLPPKEGLLPDHKDRNGLNCTTENLRYATPSQNAHNRDSRRKVRPYRGVFRMKGYKSWSMKIFVAGERIYKGGFNTAEAAAEHYNRVALERMGQFATLNTIGGVDGH